MFKCENCGEEFEWPGSYTELHGEAFSCCPYCRGDEIGEAEQCRSCGEYFFNYGGKFIDGWCSDCLKEAVGMYEEAAVSFCMHDPYSWADWLNDRIAGKAGA